MPAITNPLINGRRYDHSSLETDLAGDITLGVKSLTYDEELSGAHIWGTHASPLATTRGQYKPAGSLELYRLEGQSLVDKLCLKAQSDLGGDGTDGWGEIAFDITCTYAEVGQPTVTDKLVGCRLMKRSGGSGGGTDALTEKYDLLIMRVESDGKNMVLKALK